MKLNRWIYAAAGVIIMLFAGLIYAWSVLSAPIGAYFTEWSSAQLSFTFTLCMVFFCLGGLVAGILSKKISVKINMIVSAILLFCGFFIAGRTNSLMGLYIGYGVFAGIGSGFAYNTVMGTVSKYFPDKPGLISGILLMGFGLGSFIIGKVYQAYTPAGEGFRLSFQIFGVILLVVVLVLGVFFIRTPGKEEIEGFLSNVANKEESDPSAVTALEMNTAQMIKRSSFWLYFIWATLLSAAGLALISQAGAVVKEVNPVLTAGTISTTVGLISIFNGIGRVIFGGLFDKMGRKRTMWLIEGVFFAAMVMLIMAMLTKNFPVLVIGFIIMGLAYGGVTPTNSAFISSFYGKQNYSVNFSVINMNLVIASFGSTLAGILFDASGSYFSTFIFMLCAICVGSICAVFIKKH